MSLGQLLPATHIAPSLRATTRWAALDELVGVLIAAGAVPATSRLMLRAALVAREERMSTGIGKGVAVPHAVVDGVTATIAAFGRSAAGVDFDAMDGAPVDLIFLLIVPASRPTEHLHTLSDLSRLLTQPDVAGRLRAASTSDELHAVLAGQEQLVGR
jgi:PTS system fructose-specific IIC component